MSRSDPEPELLAGPVTLRRWRPDEADELYRVAASAPEHLSPWMPWAAGGYSDADAREHLDRTGPDWADGVAYDYAIRLPDGALIGSCSMMRRIGPGEGGRGGMEIGYWLHPDHTGRGYATAAAAALTAEVDRRPAQEATASGESGTDVVWRRRAPWRTPLPRERGRRRSACAGRCRGTGPSRCRARSG